jgi:hypothetical protein
MCGRTPASFTDGYLTLRSWQIIIVGVAAATIGTALLLVPVAQRAQLEAPAFLLAHWAAELAIWLTLYTVIALLLTTGTALAEIAVVTPARLDHGSPGLYVVRLAITQYFTGVIALFGLGLSSVPVDTAAFFPLPAVIAAPALSAAGAVSLLGLVGWLLVMAPTAFWGRGAPQPADGPSELQLLHEILDLLRRRTRTPVLDAPADAAEIIKRMQQGQRSVLEVVKELVTAVSQLSQRLDEIQSALQDRQPVAESDSRSELDEATGELRASVATLGASTGRLAELVSLLAAWKVPGEDDTAPSIGSRVQLSTELREVLQEMNPGSSGNARR